MEGELSDQNWDDAYEFCVYYTGFGFNSAWIDARIEGDYNGINTWALQTDSEGPIATLESVWSDGTLKGSDSIVVIPRGFDFQYDNEFECEFRFPPCRWEDPADHHLRQIAYSLFQTGASPNPDGNPHWVTQTIFKDFPLMDFFCVDCYMDSKDLCCSWEESMIPVWMVCSY